MIMMIFLLRGASTAKQSQRLSGAELTCLERAWAPPETGVHSPVAGVHLQGPPEAGVHSPDYDILALLWFF